MTDSMYEKAIIHYQFLHPMLQKRYELAGLRTFCGEGVMSEIKGGSLFVRMLLKTGVFFRCFFSERGTDIPFTIENKNRQNGVEWNRTFFFKGKTRFFDAVMEYDERENRILDYFGKPHILLSELHLEASSDGGLVITSGKQWLLIGGKKILLPAWLCGSSTVYEAYDEEINCFSRMEEMSVMMGFIYLAGGGFWFFAYILKIPIMDFGPLIVLLTAVHFHYSAFLIPIFNGLLGRVLRENRVLYMLSTVILLISPILIALGITFSKTLDVIAVALYLTGLYVNAYLSLRRRLL